MTIAERKIGSNGFIFPVNPLIVLSPATLAAKPIVNFTIVMISSAIHVLIRNTLGMFILWGLGFCGVLLVACNFHILPWLVYAHRV